MNFYIPGHIMRWLGPIVIINVFIWIVTWTPEAQYALCSKTDNCLISWVGALSGWAAAAGALYAANITLRPLLRQVEEAKRQADFSVGDAEPEFVLGRSRRKNNLHLRVTNWNRRNVIIESVVAIEASGYEVTAYWPIDRERKKLRSRGRYRIDGWIDRSSQPMRRYFELEISCDGLVVSDMAKTGKGITVEARYRIVGQVHERRCATASALDIAEGD